MEKIFNHKSFTYFVWTSLANLPPVSTILAKLVAKFVGGSLMPVANLPPVSLLPVVYLDLRMPPRMCKKIWNGPNWILWAWGKLIHEKKQKQKSRDTVPLRYPPDLDKEQQFHLYAGVQEPKCGFSRQLMEILHETSLPFKHFDILEDNQVREGLKKFSNWPTYPQVTVPQIRVFLATKNNCRFTALQIHICIKFTCQVLRSFWS
jgi:hypothetical protein